MAEEADSHAKTEDPTPRRLEEARKKGDVAKSPDLPQWMALMGAATVAAMSGGWLARDMMIALLPFIAHPDAFALGNGGAVAVMRLAMTAAAPALLMVFGAAALSGVAGNLVQHGLLWSPDKLKLDFAKVSPAAGFKRLYGVDGLMNFLKSILKVIVISIVCYASLRPHFADFIGLVRMQPVGMLPFTAALLRALIFSVAGVLGVTAVVDYLWQRQRFMQRMRMSHQEVKEEMRQSDGDPLVKGKLRQQRMERARRRMMQAVPRATVVVTNPTHYAVALFYEPGKAPVPQCLAKGVDKIAFRIREIAEAAGVPIVEDPPLARALYATVEVDETIPEQHFAAVAKVIGFILNTARKTAPPAWR